MNSTDYKQGLVLGGCAAIAILVIMLAFALTRTPIEKTEQEQLHKNLSQLLVPGTYDNFPATDFILISDSALSGSKPTPVYRATWQGEPTGVVITAEAPDGYNGAIKVLIGLKFNADIVAVRVTNHKETPGLGDDIDVARSDWIEQFSHLVPANMQPNNWDVKKYNGQFDQFTGATITPRAVVRSVHRVVNWFENNKNSIFSNDAHD